MPLERAVTRECARKDFKGCKTHADVWRLFGGHDIIKAFKRSLDPVLNDDRKNFLDRNEEYREHGSRRDPPPGPRRLHKLDPDGYRGYLWLDDGSAPEAPEGGAGDVVWMVCFGPRMEDTPSRDVHQNRGRAVMLSATDDWMPKDADYKDLAARRASASDEHDVAAITAAVAKAHLEQNVPHPVALAQMEALLAEVHEETRVEGVLYEDHHYRYFVMPRRYSATEPVPGIVHTRLAGIAFKDRPDGTWGETEVSQVYLFGVEHLRDDTHIVFAADLTLSGEASG